MNNIMGLLKYKLKFEGCFVKNISILSIITILLSLVKFEDYSLGVIAESILLVMIIGVFFAGLSEASKSLNKEVGRVLLLAPIKGLEFFIASVMEFLVYYISYGILFGISEVIMELTGVSFGLSIETYLELAEVLIFSFILLLSIIILVKAYVSNSKLRVIAIIAGVIVWSIIDEMLVLISEKLPYVYLIINNYEIDIIGKLLFIITLGIIVYITMKIFDRKIEIK